MDAAIFKRYVANSCIITYYLVNVLDFLIGQFFEGDNEMKLLPKYRFLGILIIGGLISVIGTFLLIEMIRPLIFDKSKLPEGFVGVVNGEEIRIPPKNNTATKTDKNFTKPDAAGTYFEGTTIPQLTEKDLWVAMMTWHKGPQTVEALMDSYQVAYLQDESRRRIDKRYPPEQWLQYLLDKGVTFHNFLEYAQYMDARVVTDRIDNIPGLLQEESETFGIPVSDVDRIKKRYLEHHLLFLKRKHAMERTVNEQVTGGIHIGGKVLPFYKDREVVYVQSEKNKISAKFFGSSLNDVQIFNLMFRGIEPESIEVIYIDEMGNQLSEKPEPVTREEIRKMMKEGEAPPPDEWWDPNTPIPDSEDFEEFLPPERTDTELDKQKQRAREEIENLKSAARAEFEIAAQAEYKKFMREVRQLEEFATMSDAEIAAELEKQLLQQLFPDLPTEASLEDALRETITRKPVTPKRFEKAKQILERHGPKEGLRRLAKDDPELAEYFLRNPKEVPPKRSQPINPKNSK